MLIPRWSWLWLTLAAALWSCGGELDTPGPDGGLPDGGGDGGDRTCEDVECPPGQECVAGSCQSTDPCEDVRCETPGEVCVGGVCVSGEADDDGDGFRAGEDCDDSEATVFPGAEEVCNGRDDDCNAEIDEGFDLDGDGFTICGGSDPAQADCDDLDEAVHPDATEACNGRDDDCDGATDEGVAGVGEGCGSDTGECQSGTRACVDGDLVCQDEVGPRSERCDGSADRDCDGDAGCRDSQCEAESCGGDDKCFGGVCASPCDTHNDGSVSCSTLCGWCRGSCRGAITDPGTVVPCSHDGDPMWCYCQF